MSGISMESLGFASRVPAVTAPRRTGPARRDGSEPDRRVRNRASVALVTLAIGALGLGGAGCFSSDPDALKLVVGDPVALAGPEDLRITTVAFHEGALVGLGTMATSVVWGETADVAVEIALDGTVGAVTDLSTAAEEARSLVQLDWFEGTQYFEAVAIDGAGDLVLTSADANGWIVPRVTLTPNWYFCLLPGSVEMTWRNSGIAIDFAGGRLFTNPTAYRRNWVSTNDLEEYDLATGDPVAVTPLDLGRRRNRAESIAWMSDRGTLLAVETDRLHELSSEGVVLASRDLRWIEDARAVGYDASTSTAWLLAGPDGAQVLVPVELSN